MLTSVFLSISAASQLRCAEGSNGAQEPIRLYKGRPVRHHMRLAHCANMLRLPPTPLTLDGCAMMFPCVAHSDCVSIRVVDCLDLGKDTHCRCAGMQLFRRICNQAVRHDFLQDMPAGVWQSQYCISRSSCSHAFKQTSGDAEDGIPNAFAKTLATCICKPLCLAGITSCPPQQPG